MGWYQQAERARAFQHAKMDQEFGRAVHYSTFQHTSKHFLWVGLGGFSDKTSQNVSG